jgi:iron complex transport system permease protein
MTYNGKDRSRSPLSAILLASLVLVAVCAASILSGARTFSLGAIASDPEIRALVVTLRVPRTLFAVLVGAGLSIVGVCYQALFRNYLASPFTLGVSSGAALAASTALVFGLTAGRYSVDVGVCAIVGALASIALILLISSVNRPTGKNSLLLVGIVFSFFCSSLLTLIQYVSDYSQLFRVTRWMMGGIPAVGWDDLIVGAACVMVTFVWLWRHERGLDLMLFGDDLASVKGVDVRTLTRTAFVLTSFVIGWIVAQCGVIGFVGIVVPAIARIIIGLRHKYLLPLAALLGAALVVFCDLMGRMVIAPFEIPAGVFTSVIGGPIFILLMIRPSRMVDICR